MKRGQIHGPAKKKIVAGGRVGVSTGVVLVAVSMPFLLGAAARTQGFPGPRPAAISGCAGARYRRPSCQKPAGGSSRRDPTQTNLRRASIRGCERAMAARRTRNRRLDPGLVGPRQPRVSDDRHTEVVDGAGRWRERRRDCSKARGSEEAGRAGCGSKARRG